MIPSEIYVRNRVSNFYKSTGIYDAKLVYELLRLVDSLILPI